MTALNLASVANINDSFLNLYKFLNKVNNDGDKSNCLYMTSVFNAFNFIYEGTKGESRRNLEKTHLKALIEASPEPMQRRSAVFVRGGFNFNPSYARKFKDRHLLDAIPTDERSVSKVNDKMWIKFPNWPDKSEKFIDRSLDGDLRVYVKDQSYFEGYWEDPFEKGLTEMKNFHIGKNKTIQVPTMYRKSVTGVLTYHDEEKKCYFISLSYLRKEYTMLIVMPEEPLTKSQLVEFCVDKLSGEDITAFYNGKGRITHYRSIFMPKFEFETNWNLDSCKLSNPELSDAVNAYCPYLKTIFDSESLNLKNMVAEFQEGFAGIKMLSKTKITNNENGTFVKASTEIMYSDCAPFGDTVLKINRSFVHMIVKKNFHLCSIGTFVG